MSYEEQIMSEHMFAPNGGYCLRFIILQIFFATRAALKIGEYSRIFPSFSWGIFGHVKSLDQSRTSKKDFMDYNYEYNKIEDEFHFIRVSNLLH